jgi:hypothetical protein
MWSPRKLHLKRHVGDLGANSIGTGPCWLGANAIGADLSAHFLK